MEICLHVSMNSQKECKLCREEDALISSRSIRTQFGCKLHNEWVCKKNERHWKLHMLNCCGIRKNNYYKI